jgi:hypothetical protein
MKTFVDFNHQWQAQPVAQPPEAGEAAALLEALSALLLELALSLVEGEALSPAAAPAPAAGADVAPEPPLKSVAYQPEPLS